MRKRIFSLILAAAVAFSLLGTIAFAGERPLVDNGANSKAFTDVSGSFWAYEAINRVVDYGLFKGTSDTEFSPEGSMTRAMYVVVLSRLDKANVEGAAKADRFTDVDADSWYAGSVNWAAEKELVLGCGDGTFRPNEPITREQIAVMLYRYLNNFKNYNLKLADPAAAVFSDMDKASDYASEAIEYCRIHGLSNGFPDGTYQPGAFVTRAQVAAMLSRIILIIKDAGPDNQGTGGTGGPAVSESKYVIKATVTVPIDLPEFSRISLSKTYKGEKNVTVATVLRDLVGASENETVIRNCIEAAIAVLKNRIPEEGKTRTVKDLAVKISKDAEGNIIISSETPDIGLKAKLDEVSERYLKDENRAYEKFENKFVSLSPDAEAAWRELYKACDPTKALKKHGADNLTILEVDEYYNLLKDITDKSAKFWETLKESPDKYDKYNKLIELVDSKKTALQELGGSVALCSDAADILAASDGFLIKSDGSYCGDHTGNNALLKIEYKLDADKYGDIRGKAVERVPSLDGLLPDLWPDGLNFLTGNYELTITLQKTA